MQVDSERVSKVTTALGQLLVLGSTSAEVTDFRARVRDFIDSNLAPLAERSEEDGRFPRNVVFRAGASGIYTERWAGGSTGDLGRSVILAEELGRSGIGGLAVGLTVHFEASVGLLSRFARTGYARQVLASALAGDIVCCVAATEQLTGSDPAAVSTALTPSGSGWRVSGTKWFVSPGAAADVIIMLCRAAEGPALVLVPRDGVSVRRRVDMTGLRGLETARLDVDALVPPEAILVRPGLGVPALTAGLSPERLSIAAHVLGTMDLALTLAVTHLRRRRQSGVPLFQHQALRLRMADLSARVDLVRRGMYALVAEMSARGAINVHQVAGLKVTAARLGEEVIRECAHIFGGHGLEAGATPMPRLLRDVLPGRVGGGTDEIMWELVAGGLRADDDVYDRWVA